MNSGLAEFFTNLHLHKSGVRNKLLLLFIMLAAAPLLILGSSSLYLIDLTHRHDVSALELQLINQKIEEVNKFLADTLGILELRVGFVQRSEIELGQQEFLLEGLLEENKAFAEASFIGLTGRETAIKDREGNRLELTDVSLLDKFSFPASGKNYVSDVRYTLAGPMVTMSAPVRNRNGEIIQALSAEVNLSSLAKSVELASLGSAGYLLLLDRNGFLINQTRGATIAQGTDLSIWPRAGSVLKGETLDGLAVKDRYQSLISRTAVVGAGKTIPGIGWVLLAEWPLQDADLVLQSIRSQVLGLTLASILAVLLIAPLFAVRLVKPIKELEGAARDIEKGNFEKRTDIKTGDELEDLGGAFNKMSDGLKRLKELKDEFVFVAAHELRAPTTVIKGYISMILEGSAGKITAQAKQFLEQTQKANQQLLQLVSDLLEIARSDAGRIQIEVFSVDIRETVDLVLEEIKVLAMERKIKISYRRPKEMVLALADTSRLNEVLMNFLSNAVKYNRENGSITVSHEQNGNEIITHINDIGNGIPRDEQKKIFEKFYRTETARASGAQGTGLGLFITKELVERMGGKVWFESQEGEGTTFSFSLVTGTEPEQHVV